MAEINQSASWKLYKNMNKKNQSELTWPNLIVVLKYIYSTTVDSRYSHTICFLIYSE